MNNHSLFYEIIRIYGRTALRLIRRHKRCSSKLARYTNHLTFLTRCIKNRVVPKDLQVRPPGERIRLTQEAEGDAKKETESTAQSITSTLSTNDANRILEQIETNTQRVFNTTKDRHKHLRNLYEKNRRLCHRLIHRMLTKLTGLLIYLLDPLAMPI